jgi:NSS family neurotransmitter:Na+ symporter
MVALLGGLAIFPALFSFKMNPEAGTGLVFKTLPVIFNQIPLGSIIMPIFFILLVIAALTSTISLLEVITAYFIDEKGWTRKKTVVLMGLTVIILGIPSVLSFGLMSPDKVGFNFEGIIEHLTADYMLPVGAFLMSLFVGFVWKKKNVMKEIQEGSEGFPLAEVWLFIVRYLAPFIMGQIILFGILNEFEGLSRLVEKLNNIFSLIDAALVVLLILGTIVYLVGRKRSPHKSTT